MQIYLEVKSGNLIDAESGKIVKDQPYFMASQTLYRAKKGDCLIVKDQAFLLAVATYSDEIAEEYMYTYMYEDEQNWSHYNHDFSEEKFSICDYVFEKDCWFRICLKKQDENWCIPQDAMRVNEIIAFHSESSMEVELPVYFAQEVQKTADTVLEKLSGQKSLVFALLSDSHYVANGKWNDTIQNIKEVHKKVGFDGIIHLGDIQDGILDKQTCRRITASCINDMRSICEPVYIAIGNHDTNYFKGNTEWLNEEDQYGIFGRFNDRYVNRRGGGGILLYRLSACEFANDFSYLI